MPDGAAPVADLEAHAMSKAILDAMPDCVKIFDASGRLIHINPKGLELLQAPDLASLSRPGYLPVAPEYLDACVDVHRRVMAGESVVWTYEVIGLEGRRLHVEAHAVPFRTPDGGTVHMSISRDVNERQQALEALQRSEERLRLVQEATGLADFESTPGRISQISDALIEQTGLPLGTASLSIEEWMEIVHPDDREHFARNMMANVEHDDTVQCEFRIVRPDNGEVRWIYSRTRLKRDAEGKAVASIGAHLDITERKLAEEELRHSEERMRLVHEATGLADFETDPDGVSICSDRFFAQCGLPVTADRKVVFEEWLSIVHPDDRDTLVSEVRKALLDQDKFGCLFRIVRADTGEVRWISSRTRVECDDDGRVLRTIGAHLDVTEHKRADEALRASEERLRLVQEATGLADFEANREGLVELSERFVEQAGLPPGNRHLHHHEWMQIVHPEDRERLAADIARSLEQDEAFQCEFRIVRPVDGEVRWISSRTKVERDAAGRPTRTIGAHLDITERKRTEQAVRESEERFRLAAEAAGLGVWDYDLENDRREWSERLRQLFGIAADVEPGLGAAVACIHPDDREDFERTLRQARAADVARFDASFRILRANDGAERWMAMNGWRTYRADNRLRRIIMTVRDITDEKTAEERARWIASHDTLTGLANRGLFHERLDAGIDNAREHGRQVGLLLLDMDHFKQINDSLGHDAGDMLLKMFAKRLRGVVRHCDTVARFGGDEFAVVLPEIEGEAALITVAQAVQQRLREPFIHAGRIIDSRVSIGASLFPAHGAASAELLKCADVALLAAKNAGRGCVTLFEQHMRDDVERRGSMVRRARDAIEDERIVPYYQPKLDLAGRSLAGFEALLRWRMPSGRIGSPASLEAAFEDIEVAAQISDRMIERVIADMRDWRDRGIAFQTVAVNAAAAEFRRNDFGERVLERLGQAGIPASCFQLEVTESVFLGRGAEYVHRALTVLSEHGVGIALDDFGTGYASLRHLKQFPVDIIKIDQGFVRDMEADPGDEAIVRAVINLGRSFGIRIVAEGIEQEEQARRLLEMGCDYGQGFLFSRAVPASRVPALVERWPVRVGSRPLGDLRLVAARRA